MSVKAKSNQNEKELITKSDLTMTVTSLTDGVIPLVLVKGYGIIQIRCTGYTTAAISNGTTVTWQLGIKPKTTFAGLRYWRTSSSGFELALSAQGALTLTPFGGEIAKGGGVYFNETVLIE